jgi:hypothetical protein
MKKSNILFKRHQRVVNTLNTYTMNTPNLISRLFLTAMLIVALACTKDDDNVPLSDSAEITKFTISDMEATITGGSITITLPNGTNPSKLMAKAVISENATIDPDPETETDYTGPIKYTVTAEDGTTKKTYTVTVIVEKDNQANILDFEIDGVKGTITGDAIAIAMPEGTDPSKLTAKAVISENATIDPDPVTEADYTDPVKYTVTAEDGTNKKEYTVTVTVAGITPTADNPYSEGVFILTPINGSEHQLDFRHTSGTVTTKVFQTANNGRKIDGFEIYDIIPHDKGYLITADVRGGDAKVFFTDLKLKIKKEESIKQANSNSGRYAQIGNKVYYCNVLSITQANDTNNAVYVFDTDAETVTTFGNLQHLQFFTDSSNNLYYIDLVSDLYEVTDLNTLAGTKVAEFNDYTESLVLDDDNKLWGIYPDRTPTLAEIFDVPRGLFNYRLKMFCYDMNTNTLTEGTSTTDINRNSDLFASNGKTYLITNQNNHIDNAKKQLEELYIDGNDVKLNPKHELPKLSNTQLQITRDNAAYDFIGSTVVVLGDDNDVPASNSRKTFYYDLDVNTGTVSNKTLGATNIFERKATQ